MLHTGGGYECCILGVVMMDGGGYDGLLHTGGGYDGLECCILGVVMMDWSVAYWGWLWWIGVLHTAVKNSKFRGIADLVTNEIVICN